MAPANGMQNIEDPESEEDRLLPAAQGRKDCDVKRSSTPCFAWPLLIGAVVAVSSAGVVFTYMDDVPPLTLAGWRLQATSAILAFGFAFQWYQLGNTERHLVCSALHLLTLSGVCLGFHFGLWVWGLQHTSLAHSLLFVSVSPIIIALVTWALGWGISRGELIGTALGVVGVGILAAGGVGSKRHRVQLIGDLASIGGAGAAAGYFMLGSHVRQWLPIYIYAFPVTFIAGTLLTVAGVLLEGNGVLVRGATGVCGWVVSPQHLPYVIYLALGPGLVGHTGLNTLLRYFPPLGLTLAMAMEPVLGPLLGWGLRVAPFPRLWTILGGAVLVTAVVCVVVAAHKRQNEERSAESESCIYNIGKSKDRVLDASAGDVELQ